MRRPLSNVVPGGRRSTGGYPVANLPKRKIQNFYRENPATHSGARNSFSRRNVKIDCKLIFPVSVLVTDVQNSASVIGGAGSVVLAGANDTGSCFNDVTGLN